MASKHRLQSVGELADDPQDLARWPSAARAPRSVRGCAPRSSLNSRTFSIAITAWSAKVSSSSICFVGEGPDLRRRITMTPDGVASRAAAGPPGTCGCPRCRACHSAPATRAHLRQRPAIVDGLVLDAPAPPGDGRDRPRLASADARWLDWHRAARGGDLPQQRPPRRGRWRVVGRRTAARRSRRPRRAPAGGRSASWLITRRISRGGRLLLQRLGQLAVPRLELLEQPDVLDARSPPGRRRSRAARSACR